MCVYVCMYTKRVCIHTRTHANKCIRTRCAADNLSSLGVLASSANLSLLSHKCLHRCVHTHTHMQIHAYIPLLSSISLLRSKQSIIPRRPCRLGEFILLIPSLPQMLLPIFLRVRLRLQVLLGEVHAGPQRVFFFFDVALLDALAQCPIFEHL
jgi:hypothetical protein